MGTYEEGGCKERGRELGCMGVKGGQVSHPVSEEPQLGHRKCLPRVVMETSGL